MKKLLFLIPLFALTMFASAQTNTNTNTTIGSDILDVGNKLLNSTNMIWEMHGTYSSALQNKWGMGIGGYYLLNNFTYTGIRVDWVDGGFWMPEGNVGLQLPIHIINSTNFTLTLTPITYAGIGVPISGAVIGGVSIGSTPRNNNGQATAILGAGAAIDLFHFGSGKWNVGILGDTEKWTGFSGNQYRGGLYFKRNF